ncbi:MAG: CHAD domain-containing protein [Verrucomicrobiae bacterium]|nr:CHAD domain-containing protein [Verrucomicrobiae bacterium]
MNTVYKRVESEAKFQLNAPDEQLPHLLAFLKERHLTVGEVTNRTQVDHYFDTADFDLYRAGWSYRFRDAPDHHRSVDLKSLSSVRAKGRKKQPSALHHRQEVEIAVEAFPSSIPTIADAPLLEDLEGLVPNQTAPLNELFRVRTLRSIYKVASKKAVFTVCLDDTTVEMNGGEAADEHQQHFYELEIELEGGKKKRLSRLAEQIGEELRLVPTEMSKFERGLHAAGLHPTESPAKPQSNDESGDEGVSGSPIHRFALGCLERHFSEMVANEAVALEGCDPEGVHQMRVASRRLSTALDVFRKCLPAKKVKSLDKEIHWVTRSLGKVRDLDVFCEAIQSDSDEDAPLAKFREHVASTRRVAQEELAATLGSERYLAFKQNFGDFLNALSEGDVDPESSHDTLEMARTVVPHAVTKVRHDGAKISKSSLDEDLHRLRLDAKHLRYRLELFAPVVPGGLEEPLKACRKLQKFLGEHQDACMANQRIHCFRKSHTMDDCERQHLKKLKARFCHQKRAQRKAWPEIWNAFVSKTRPKALRRQFAGAMSACPVAPSRLGGAAPPPPPGGQAQNRGTLQSTLQRHQQRIPGDRQISDGFLGVGCQLV